MKSLLIIAFISTLISLPATKKKVTFEAADGLEITADLYIEKDEYPYILLLHQAESSRGEYNEIAFKLSKLRYNCLAVDLRSGNNSNYISNETAKKAREQKLNPSYLDTKQDIEAAIEYAYSLNHKEVILLGSSYSASLSMLVGKDHPKVSAVIAFSPGEYFGDDLRMETEIDTFAKPLFVAGTQFEAPYIRDMLKNLPEESMTLFEPKSSMGEHGAKALWDDNTSKDEYWLALLFFFNSIK